MLLRKKEYQVHGLTGQFCDASRERMYRRSILEGVSGEFSLAVCVAACVFGMFAIADYYLLGLTRRVLSSHCHACSGGKYLLVSGFQCKALE